MKRLLIRNKNLLGSGLVVGFVLAVQLFWPVSLPAQEPTTTPIPNPTPGPRWQAVIHFDSGSPAAYRHVANLETLKAGLRNCVEIGSSWCTADLYGRDDNGLVVTQTIVLSKVEWIDDFSAAQEAE